MAVYRSTWTIIDAFNRRTRTTYNHEAADASGANTNEVAMTLALVGLLGSAVVSVATATVTDVVDTASAGANNDEGITFSFDLGGGKSAARKLPGPLKSYIDTAGNVDLGDGLVTAYTDLIENGPFYISDVETAIGTNSATLDK